MKIWSLTVLLVIDSYGWTLNNARSSFIESTLSECPTGGVFEFVVLRASNFSRTPPKCKVTDCPFDSDDSCICICRDCHQE